MAAPAGSEAQFGYRYSKGVDAFGRDVFVDVANKFIRFISMSGLVAVRKLVTTDNMDPSNQTLQGVPVEAVVAPKLKFQPDTNSISPLLAHHCSVPQSSYITTPSGGVNSRQWVLVPFETGDTPSSTYIDSLIMEGTDNDGYPVRVDGARMSDLSIKIANGKIVDVECDFLACRDTYTSKATQLFINTYTGVPIIVGHWNQSLAASTLKVKVTAAAGGGFDGTVKWTTAAYAGSTTIQIKFDTWYRLVLDDGTRLGVSRDNDLFFCFPSSGATALTAGGTPDEWSFASQRVLASASYSTLNLLNSASVELVANGTTYFFHDADIKISRPRKANMVNQMYALTVQKNGPWAATITINRDRDDRDFLKKLIDAGLFAVTVKMYGNVIEGTIEQLWQIDFPNVQVSNVTRDVTTPNTLQEKVDLVARRVSTSDIFTHTLINTLTAL